MGDKKLMGDNDRITEFWVHPHPIPHGGNRDPYGRGPSLLKLALLSHVSDKLAMNLWIVFCVAPGFSRLLADQGEKMTTVR